MLLSLIIGMWAVPIGTAHSFAQLPNAVAHPVSFRAVSFREVRGRGLLLRAWVNDSGPYSFAVDTGAGATLLSTRVANEARVIIKEGKPARLTGMSGVTTSAQEVSVQSLAIGSAGNHLPGKGLVMVTSGLPRDLDGVLDPVQSFAPLGFVIDIPAGTLSAFDPRTAPLRLSAQPAEGAVVPWLQQGRERRPFVELDNGDRALLDTGSSLGFAIKDRNSSPPISAHSVRDVGGGSVSTRRVSSTTISIGSLVLRNIPTDLVTGANVDAPLLLGLNALRPFKLTFDPAHRLIEIVPGAPGR